MKKKNIYKWSVNKEKKIQSTTIKIVENITSKIGTLSYGVCAEKNI